MIRVKKNELKHVLISLGCVLVSSAAFEKELSCPSISIEEVLNQKEAHL